MEEKFSHEEGQEAGKNSPYQTKEGSSNSLKTKSFAEFNLQLVQGKDSFCRDEKLKSRKLTEQLFKEGKSVSKDGFTLVYLIHPIPSFYPAQASFSVPKRNFKHATDRNRVKRQMREVYRMNKFAVYEKLVTAQKQMSLMWIFKGKELPNYLSVQKAMLHCMDKVARNIS